MSTAGPVAHRAKIAHKNQTPKPSYLAQSHGDGKIIEFLWMFCPLLAAEWLE
jgi:hypothetical protein